MLAAKQRRESDLLSQLTDKDACIQRCKQEAENLQLELVTLRDIERSEKSQLESGQRQVSTLQERLSELEEELAWYQGRQETYEEERLSKEALEEELQRTRDNLNLRISDVQELSTNLKTVLAEKEQDESKIADMHRTLESFRNETRTRVERVVQHRNEAVALLEKTLQEKQVLVEANHDLQSARENVRREGEVRGRSNHTNYDLQSELDNMRREREELRLLKDQTNHELHSEVENMKREREDMRTRYDQINHELQSALEHMRRERDEMRAHYDQYDREEPFKSTTPSRGEHRWRSGTVREREELRGLSEHHKPRDSESSYYGDRWERSRAIVQEESRERDEPRGLSEHQQPREFESSYGDRWESSRAIVPEEPYPLHGRVESREHGGSLERYRYGGTSGDDNLDARTEELTAYMAVSAKESMERRNAENLKLQQQLYALEVARAAEKETLMARIRGLERNVDPTGYS
jgi:chromosome segregation ATPase